MGEQGIIVIREGGGPEGGGVGGRSGSAEGGARWGLSALSPAGWLGLGLPDLPSPTQQAAVC